MMIGAYVVMRSGRRVVPSKWYGKLAAVVFFAVTSAIIFFMHPPKDQSTVITLLIIAALFMFFAFVMYIPIFIRINKSKADE